MNSQKIRLQKYLANQGIESRRKCEQFILDGLISVNGEVVTQLGTKVDPEKDSVQVNQKRILAQKKYRTIMLYKPRGYVCTKVSTEGKSIYDLIPSIQENLVSIGRLDKKSEGLLILSNDGQMVYELTHPQFGHTKIYHVMVQGSPSPGVLGRLNKSMDIDGYKIQPATVQLIRKSLKPNRYLLEFILKEGRKRQIRKMCEQVGLDVCRLIRIQVNDLSSKGLKPGQWRDLSKNEIKMLKGIPL